MTANGQVGQIRLAEVNPNEETARLLSHEYALRYAALPIGLEGEHLTVAMHDPDNIAAVSDLSDITGYFIVPVAAEEEDIRYYISKIFSDEAVSTIETQFLIEERLRGRGENPEVVAEISSAPAVRIIDSLIEEGVLNRASDIHIEPFGRQLRARYRVDGLLYAYKQVDISLLPNIVSRLKIMGGMDIAENRLPQDGHFTLAVHGEKIDFRLSTLPTAIGEKVAIRLLYDQALRLKKDQLGIYPDDLENLTELFNQPYGAIFMTGPTGSGKSATLNSFLEELNRDTHNIVTVEDPVENPILGVSHVNVKPQAGFGFADALKSILRQDPDIIMIGEIRDQETARIAIQAAITGHLVLSTLHTNDAAGVIERLWDMGIEPYLVAAALNGVISQRLVRRVCINCAAPATLTTIQAYLLELPLESRVMKGKGCSHCNFTGYRSRFAVYEYLIMSEKTRRQMSESPRDFAANLRKEQRLKQTAIRALLDGRTTAEEVIRVISRDGLEK